MLLWARDVLQPIPMRRNRELLSCQTRSINCSWTDENHLVDLKPKIFFDQIAWKRQKDEDICLFGQQLSLYKLLEIKSSFQSAIGRENPRLESDEN